MANSDSPGGSPPGPHRNQPPERPDSRADERSGLVRPYAMTGGRTRPRYDLAIEALVSAEPYPPRDITVLNPEHRAIIDMCRNWRSVAEISALLRLPLGVVRVLVSDLTHDGMLRLHQSAGAGGQPDLRLLERVLSGLRKL